MVRAGEPTDKDGSNDHIHPISTLINALHSICMNDVSFAESVENGVLYSVVLPGSGNIVGDKAVFLSNFEDYRKDVFSTLNTIMYHNLWPIGLFSL